jgi:hypothetical protein
MVVEDFAADLVIAEAADVATEVIAGIAEVVAAVAIVVDADVVVAMVIRASGFQ